jgi:hypothetical protein
MKRVKTLSDRLQKHKKAWRCEEFLKKINKIRLTYHKYIRKTKIIQGSLPMNVASVSIEKVSNSMTQNNRNYKNEIATSLPIE